MHKLLQLFILSSGIVNCKATTIITGQYLQNDYFGVLYCVVICAVIWGLRSLDLYLSALNESINRLFCARMLTNPSVLFGFEGKDPAAASTSSVDITTTNYNNSKHGRRQLRSP
jgi:hypothetical protein